MNTKKAIICVVIVLILVIMCIIWGISSTDINNISNGIETTANIISNNICTTEIPDLTEEDEQTLEVQEADLEEEGFIRQGEVAYNGASKTPNLQLGEYQGLTYYNQADSRWVNYMYSSIGDSSQTMGTSGCGPTAAAMVVSSIKGVITPPEMGDLFVEYGYRSTNNGTYFSAMKWVADVFDITYQETYSLNTAVNLVRDNYYVIVSCNEGLFTYGGHFIVIVGIDGNTLKIYDPYLYSGKFNVSSRRGKATVEGNTVYVTIDNFRNYANATGYYCYKKDRTDIKENNTDVTVTDNVTSNVEKVNYTVKVNASSGLNIRSGASTSYSIIGGYTNGTSVTITAEKGNWGKTKDGWISLDYTIKIRSNSSNSNSSQSSSQNSNAEGNLNTNSNSSTKYTTGRYEVNTEILTVRTGPGTNYSWKEYSELTSNAQAQVYRECGYRPNGLCKGVQCDVTEVYGKWGKIPSGWICLDYCNKL